MRVRVVRHGDADTFMRRAQSWLLRSEAENTLILGIAADVASYAGPIYYATIEHDGAVVGCALRTPPRKLIVTRMPPSSAEPLGYDVAACFDELPGVIGPPVAAREVAAHWCARHRLVPRDAMLQRIHRLETVNPPQRQAPGELRIATMQEHGVVSSWVECFARETGIAKPDAPALVERKIAAREMVLWYDDLPRCLAGYSGRSPNGVRIGYVYTPPEWRGNGYASACVAAFSRLSLANGARFCCLFTDLANPVSNAIYRRIGYEPVCDSVDISFVRA